MRGMGESWAGLALVAALSLASAPAWAQSGAVATAEAEVRQVIADYNVAYEKNDLDTYFKAFAPDLTQWFPSGRVDLPSYRASWSKTIQGGSRNEKVEVRDLRVTFRSATGEVSTDDNQETDVLFKRNGAWSIVHVNYAPVKTQK